MRILMLSDVYFPRINGVSTSIQTFREVLRRDGHEVVLLAPHYPAAYQDDADIHRIKARSIPFDNEDRLMAYRATWQQAERLHLHKPFDVLHIQTPFVAHYAGVKLARKYAIPCVETYHTHFEEYMHNYIPLLPRGVLRPAVRWFSRRQCNSVDRVIVPSSAMQKVLLDYGVSSPVNILPTGINAAIFSAGNGDKFRHKHHIPTTQPVMVHIGRLGHEKNIDFLLRVHQQVLQDSPDTLLVIAGEGPALPHLQELARKLGTRDNILFVGYLDRNSELLDCYAAGNVFVFSSRTETQGLVLLESLALGTPVVSTAYLGTRDILLPEQGAVIAREDVGDFAGKVLEILQNRHLQQQLANEGRAYAKSWSHESLAQRLLGLYQELSKVADYTAAEDFQVEQPR